jgi:FdhE protein
VKAEACAACKTYVKIMNREKDPQVDPFADDLATLSLDVLMAEEGYQRLGFNPLLIPGD